MEEDSQSNQMQPSNNQNTQFPSVFSLYGESFDALKKAFVTLIRLALRPILALLPILLVLILQTVNTANSGSNTVINVASIIIGFLSVVAAIALAIRVAPAFTYVQLEAVRGNDVDDQTALTATKEMVGNYFFASLLTGLIIIGGFILLIIPGFFMLKRYILVGYHLVDHKLSVREAMDRSKQYSEKYSGAHWGLIGLQIVINLVTYLPLIGPIASLAMSVIYYMTPAVRYEQIKNAA